MPESKFPSVALPDTPIARELQAYCLSFPGAWEDYPWGDIVYKVGTKIFTFMGVTGDMAGVTVKAAPEDADALTMMSNITRARYIGKHGWVSVAIGSEDQMPLVRELIAASYAMIAPKRPKRGPPSGLPASPPPPQ